MTPRLNDIALALGNAQLDGWLFYDFRLSDPLAYRILGLSEDGIATRRWFCYVPAHGKPRAIVSAVEAHRLDALAVEKIVYRSHDEMIAALRMVLEGARRIAMDYSPGCAIPYVSRVDAGTIEIVRAIGVEVVTAADLIQRFEATLTREQLASHQRAARALRTIVDETFGEIAQLISAERPVSEVSVQESVMARFAARGLTTHAPPIVAVNEHSADPHYGPTAKHDRAIRRGDFILLDLWAKESAPDSIYADFTWVAYAGDKIPDEHARVFKIVADARDATIDLVQRRVAAGDAVSGREADRAARSVIEAAGFGDAFVHRTGHSIGREVHGTGANLDSLETLDDRTLIDNTCFSVEPGIYLPGKFGVRSELDMTIENGRAMVSGEPRQREIARASHDTRFQAQTGRGQLSPIMIRAVIFDLDGTLVETEPLHFAAFNEVLRADGIEIGFDDYTARLIGLNDRDCFATVLRENRKDASDDHVADLIARKTLVYQAMVAEREVLYPGAKRFVRDCAHRFPLMIATGTLRAEAEAILRRAGLRELFLDIIAAEDVERGKPEPDAFVAALGRIGYLLRQRDPVLADECLVVEDTQAGIEAAHRAGMKVLALCHMAPASDLAAADVVRASISDLDLDDVIHALRGR